MTEETTLLQDNEDFNRALEQILKLTEHALTEFNQTAPDSIERIFCSGKLVAHQNHVGSSENAGCNR
jgi:hypothetical protein